MFPYTLKQISGRTRPALTFCLERLPWEVRNLPEGAALEDESFLRNADKLFPLLTWDRNQANWGTSSDKLQSSRGTLDTLPQEIPQSS